MLIEEPSTTRRPRLLRSPLPLALLGLAGCTSMLVGLVEETPAPAAITAPFPSTGVLQAASLFTDQRLVFLMLLGGFLLMAILPALSSPDNPSALPRAANPPSPIFMVSS